MKFASWKSIYDPIVIPIPGRDGVERDYELPPVSGEDGVRWALTSDPESGVTFTADDTRKAFLGDAYQEMLADGVPDAAIARALMTAIVNHAQGREVAEAYWVNGGNPKAIADWLVEKRSTSTSTTNSTGEANATRKPASTSGTRRRKK